MSTVLVTSPDTNAGKTTFCVALGQRLGRLGMRVGYRRLPGPGAEADATFVRAALQQRDPIEVICPPADRAMDALAFDGDVLIVEAGDPETTTRVARTDNVISVIVARFRVDGLSEAIVSHARALATPNASVILNVVPEKGLRQARQRITPDLESAGLSVLGVVPQDRVLLGTTVGELAKALDAEILCATDQLSLPVEAVMIAAMSDEGAEDYFRRISRKAVVAAGDRPDIHMPALATDTSCIVLSQYLDPDPTVFKTADQEGVPLLKVRPDTFVVLDQIAMHFSEVRFRQRHKVGPAVSAFREHLNETALFSTLGIDGREVA